MEKRKKMLVKADNAEAVEVTISLSMLRSEKEHKMISRVVAKYFDPTKLATMDNHRLLVADIEVLVDEILAERNR